MAPELFSDPLGAGPQSDVYSLGIILYELLTRKIPGRRSPMPSDVVKGLPRTIDDIFDRMTRDSRDERYKTAEEVLDAFYRADDIRAVSELQGSILFFKSPLETLKFKEAPREEEPPPPAREEPVAPEPAPVAAAAAGPPTEENAAATPPPVAEPGKPADRAESQVGSSRALGRRPYSFQQRLKDREKE
jgi:serine/threonine-protein kinase